MRVRGYFFIILAAGLWGLIGPFSRLAFDEGLAPLEVAFWRASIAWLFFGSHAFLRRKMRVRRCDIPLLGVFGIAGVSLFFGIYQYAVNYGGAALASVLLYTAPIWVAVLSFFLFGDRMNFAKLAALAVTLMGVAGVALGSGNFSENKVLQINMPAIVFGLSAGFCYSLYYIFGKHFARRYDAETVFLYILPAGFAGLYPFVQFSNKTLLAWASLLFIAFFSTYGAYYFYYAGLKYLDATRASIAATLEPVVAGIVAYFWWGERFSLSGYIGSLLILSAVILMILEGTRSCSDPST